jgi:type III secretion system FlhB-like substrate exporter
MRRRDRSSRALSYLTEHSPAPKIVRQARNTADARPGAERPSDRILRVVESEGWAAHRDPELLDFLATLDIDAHVPLKLNELIAEVIFFCWELDTEDPDGTTPE